MNRRTWPLMLALGTVPAAAQLTDQQQKLYQFWNDAAKRQCGKEQITWEQKRAKYASSQPKEGQTPTLEQLMSFSEMYVARATLSECKGDYWLHFLITPEAKK